MVKTQVRRLALVAVVVSVLGMWFAGPVAAHTGFESSNPSDGAVLDEPVELVTLVFSGEAEPTGEGFEALDVAGQIRSPAAATSDDGRRWVLRFEPALGGGAIGVRWTVKAPDAHPISGAFSFTAPAPQPELADSELTQQANEPQSVDSDPVPQTAEAPGSPQVASAGGEGVAPATQELSEFLDTANASLAGPERLAAAGRVLSYGAALLGVGAFVFVAMVLRGDGNDIRFGVFWVRRFGLVVLVGVAIEFVAQMAIEAGGWSAMWSLANFGAVLGSSLGLALALRFAGGLALVSGSRMAVRSAEESTDLVIAIRYRVPVGAIAARDRNSIGVPNRAPGGAIEEPYQSPGDAAWVPEATSWVAFAGVGMLLASHLFDGHTVSKGNWALTGLLSLIHVGAAAVWVGGVVMLAAVLWHRTRRRRPLGALQLAVRFSVLATVALVAVALAGLGLAILVLDSVSELWTTPWGRLLMLKTALVALAACGGAYNHKVLIPELASNEALSPRFRRAVTVEATALVLVLVVTAVLVGAAS